MLPLFFFVTSSFLKSANSCRLNHPLLPNVATDQGGKKILISQIFEFLLQIYVILSDNGAIHKNITKNFNMPPKRFGLRFFLQINPRNKGYRCSKYLKNQQSHELEIFCA